MILENFFSKTEKRQCFLRIFFSKNQRKRFLNFVFRNRRQWFLRIFFRKDQKTKIFEICFLGTEDNEFREFFFSSPKDKKFWGFLPNDQKTKNFQLFFSRTKRQMLLRIFFSQGPKDKDFWEFSQGHGFRRIFFTRRKNVGFKELFLKWNVCFKQFLLQIQWTFEDIFKTNFFNPVSFLVNRKHPAGLVPVLMKTSSVRVFFNPNWK